MGQEIVQKTLQEKPENATHWSRASMAFIWTASANDILAKVARARKTLDATHGADSAK
jgi:hypothetical protein